MQNYTKKLFIFVYDLLYVIVLYIKCKACVDVLILSATLYRSWCQYT